VETAFLHTSFWNSIASQTVSVLEKQAGLLDSLNPWFAISLFLSASAVMIWRLGVMERKGLEGTVLGTLIMPYASGFSNLMFAFVLGRSGGPGALVLENCLVNNVTNLTLIIGLCALIWSLALVPSSSRKISRRASRDTRINYLSLLLTLTALFFFTGALWALARDRTIDYSDGLVLVGMFLFWQLFHVFDVLKHNVLRKRTIPKSIALDMLLVILAGFATYYSIDRLVAWIPRGGGGLISFKNLGWLSGLLMVFPNALVALYYAWAKRADIVLSSQIGDGHICIPMCVGLFALFNPIQIPPSFYPAVIIILGAGLLHFIFLAFFRRLPRGAGLVLTGAYALFLYLGVIH
jgi:cation:H+ antiporter